MKTIYWTLGLGALLVLAVGFYLVFFVFSGILTPFGRACRKVEVGMSRQEAQAILANFENKNGVEFKDRNNKLSYQIEGMSGYYQCYIDLDENNKVKNVLDIFD